MLFFVIPLLAVLSWIGVLRLHPGDFSGAWWIQRKPVIHKSVNMHARWRSDLKKGYVLQRLWSECIGSLFPFLSSSSLHRTLFLSSYSFLVFFLSFCASLLFSFCLSLSLCLGATLRFQSWWELENSPAALRFLLVIPSKGTWHTHTLPHTSKMENKSKRLE